jgi:tetratricopeptide (TPR) repeat protein
MQRFSDISHRDVVLLLRNSDPANPIWVHFAWFLHHISPFAPVARAALIDRDWARAQGLANTWGKQSPHPLVQRALGRKYTELKRWPEAEACLKRALELSPDGTHYEALADCHKAQGRMDLWKQTWDTFLEKEADHGLEHAQVRVAIANDYMQRQQWKEAKPYAEKAAATGAAWAMLCASRCATGLAE